MRPIFRLLSHKADQEGWGSRERMGLRSLVSGRQWPQVRLVAAGYADSPSCNFCCQDAQGRSQNDESKKGTK